MTDLQARPPDRRITCLFVASTRRTRGLASLALAGALEEIGRLGGATEESCPEDTAERKVSSSFLDNATVSLFERHGCGRTRRLGKNPWVVTTTAP